ncbi:uncharacterized protein MELLADRAFT_101650 [Melampsora larici-populina 98AG31]|uniref:Uncharacterized protein n=1 Tax=Melampsora larici-populina (strain 98AG31 / pathotype 3-4-7) TaxID=747676 RepID=F4R6I7_MELLP|nr:uncharacterized protein MELLADRAFT_101650 [Melampsora larici-populina 98AG31]EGG12458.1 hypothetical protein MELLADRAFT_101650 [Melampsora larici-populina 98AG31]
MSPNPYACRLNRLRRKHKPATPLQEAFIAQQAKNRAQAGQASQAFFQGNAGNPRLPVEYRPEWVNIPMDEEDEFDDHPPEPHFNAMDKDKVELLERIARAQYHAKRLEKQKQWLNQCEKMLPFFLCGRQLTSEWGDILKWDSDHKREFGSMTSRFKVVLERLEEAQKDLANIETQSPALNLEYMKNQWARQKEMQARIISETAEDKQEQILVLIELEEDMLEAYCRVEAISAKRPRMRTGAERAELLDLPQTLIALKQKVQDLAEELGSDEFLHLTGTSDSQSKLLLTVRLSKSKLYKAKVGVIENQRRAALNTGDVQAESRLLYLGLVLSLGRLWMTWSNGLRSMLESTSMYFADSHIVDVALLTQWEEMCLKSAMEWAAIVNLPSLIAEAAEEDEDVLEDVADVADVF